MAGKGSARGLAGTLAPEASNIQVPGTQEAVEAALEAVYTTLASLHIVVVDGYFVKVWQDWDSGEWVADCPTVKAVAQEESFEEAVVGTREAIRGMLATLSDGGHPIPPRDL